MSDTPRTRIEPEPSYPCCNCYEEYSWNAQDLRWFNGELWCANCFDELDAAGDRLLWSDLERFVPKLERENAELKQKAEAAESLLLTIQAWDIDKHELRGHQCLAKQWICSWQDRLDKYKRGKK